MQRGRRTPREAPGRNAVGVTSTYPDALTDLPNPDVLHDARQAARVAKREGQPLALL